MDRRTLSLAALGGPVSVLAAVWWLDRWGTRPTDAGPWDALVVAGCRVRADGSPSPALQRRIAHAAALWTSGVAPVLVTTGGATTPGQPAEAVVAAAGLRALGVPEHALVVEDRSVNTWENAVNSRALLGRDAAVLVVSCHYHRWRCERLFAHHFSRVGSSGPVAPGTGRFTRALREVVSIADAGWSRRL